MKTTESGRRTTPGPLASLKLYLTAFLAGLYLVIWWSLDSRAPSADQTVAAPAATATRRSRAAIWYQNLPPSARPVLQLPQGWSVADDTSGPRAVDEAPPVPVRVASQRARTRTRSS
jgi:hypothetical protein